MCPQSESFEPIWIFHTFLHVLVFFLFSFAHAAIATFRLIGIIGVSQDILGVVHATRIAGTEQRM